MRGGLINKGGDRIVAPSNRPKQDQEGKKHSPKMSCLSESFTDKTKIGGEGRITGGEKEVFQGVIRKARVQGNSLRYRVMAVERDGESNLQEGKKLAR